MSERLIALLIVALLTAAVWLALWAYQARFRGHLRGQWPGFGPVGQGKAVLLVFTGPYCLPCKLYQRPAVEQLKQELDGRLVVTEIDAIAQPELARQYGVITVPSTVVIDADGEVQAINFGYASADKLRQQLEGVPGAGYETTRREDS